VSVLHLLFYNDKKHLDDKSVFYSPL